MTWLTVIMKPAASPRQEKEVWARGGEGGTQLCRIRNQCAPLGKRRKVTTSAQRDVGKGCRFDEVKGMLIQSVNTAVRRRPWKNY